MPLVVTIASRQFRSFFNGPTAYIVLALVLFSLGFLFWETFFLYDRASLREMFNLLRAILVVATPALTMGLIAEEKRTGTIELLLTMPVTDRQVLLGKYLGVLAFFMVLIALTFPYAITVATLGPLDWGPVFSGYLGLFLQGAAMLAIGLMASTISDNQIVAFFVGLMLIAAFAMIGMLLPLLPVPIASIAEYVSFTYHFDGLSRGVIDLRAILYYLSIALIAGLIALRSLESRSWS
ncbi:MAG: ABC transporter permease subunit [Sandaracinaceae bacterium]|nr:ABC transporter permease subunit [Sandaracinaceae bacterium]